MQIPSLTIEQVRTGLLAREFSATELATEALRFAGAENPKTNAYLRLSEERAMTQAARVDAAIARGEDPGALAGVPVAVKDVIVTRGIVTTCGSRMLETYVPPYDATAIVKLEAAGGIILGKTNCDEFAMGSSTENSAFGPVSNPWDIERVPGGSSGGSAATVAAGTVAVSLGTDTGGSIRQPAALCGVVGYKPTYGRVSRYGLIAFASSLDQIGPFTRTVEDCAVVFSVIAGHDPADSTSAPSPVDDPTAELRSGVAGMRLGVPREYFGDGIDAGVRGCVERALRDLEELGATLVDVSLPHTDTALATYYVVAPAECSSNLARYDGVRFGLRVERPSLTETYLLTREQGFGPEVKRRVMLGTYALSSGYYDAYYRKAQKVRTVIAGEFSSVFEDVDALVCPTSPTPAFPIGERDDPLSMYMCDVLTIPVNLAGLPGISVPCGFVDDLPVGLQVIAPRFQDARVFRVAHAYEQATEWHRVTAPVGRAA